MKLRLRRLRRLPRRIKSWLARPFDAKEIDAPGLCRVERTGDEAFHRQHQNCPPRLRRFVDTRATFQPTGQIAFPVVLSTIEIDIQIDPVPVRRDFKFLVFPRLRRIALHKQFANVLFPKLVAPAARIRIVVNGDAAIFRAKLDKKRFGSPQAAAPASRASDRRSLLANPNRIARQAPSPTPRPAEIPPRPSNRSTGSR